MLKITGWFILILLTIGEICFPERFSKVDMGIYGFSLFVIALLLTTYGGKSEK